MCDVFVCVWGGGGDYYKILIVPKAYLEHLLCYSPLVHDLVYIHA